MTEFSPTAQFPVRWLENFYSYTPHSYISMWESNWVSNTFAVCLPVRLSLRIRAHMSSVEMLSSSIWLVLRFSKAFVVHVGFHLDMAN
ncbi:nuclear hormone receptor HR96 isoform X1 [Biomphalaria glabrata]|nr:nuclear hormone receptor HR96 isoform X1 [Biomphalaria glabrata]